MTVVVTEIDSNNYVTLEVQNVCTIKVVGLGSGDAQQLPIGIYEELKNAQCLLLRTREHPVVSYLEQKGIQYRSFDDIYINNETFEDVYEQIVEQLIQLTTDYDCIHYAVPGHPMVAEQTVQALINKAEAESFQLEIMGGQSFLDALFARLKMDPNDGCIILDGTSLHARDINPQLHTVITQVYDAFVASDVKLSLMEVFPDDYEIVMATAVGIKGQEVIEKLPLYKLDRMPSISNLTAVYVPPTEEESIINRCYSQTREIFRVLRGPEGCAWDRKQTHESLKKYVLEEAHEVVEAIEEGDVDHLKEELGDLLLQVFLHAQIAEDDGLFQMEDVLASLNEKMIRRHPHVFGDEKLTDEDDILRQWKQIKEEEKRLKRNL